MGVVTLREAISKRADELMVPALMAAGLTSHKKRNWKTCECTWCAKKREATAKIANMAHIPAYRFHGQYVQDMRHIFRDELRAVYRQEMRALEREEPF